VSETLDALRAFGHEVEARDESFRVSRGSAPPARYAVPGDYSSAIPLLCATAAVGGEVVLTGLAESCGVADAAALPVLAAMGVAVRFEDGALAARASGPPAPVAVRATDLPDSVPPLAALATRASGPSRFEGIGHLRWKESDRVAALADLLGAAGARCEVLDDALIVHPAEARPAAGPIRAGTRSDHRIAMAAAILAVSRGGMLIEDPGCVAKSYPAFFRDLSRLATPARAPASVATI
jgi:3-phosphoshikimate 1-carboxyvinyltransferase